MSDELPGIRKHVVSNGRQYMKPLRYTKEPRIVEVSGVGDHELKINNRWVIIRVK